MMREEDELHEIEKETICFCLDTTLLSTWPGVHEQFVSEHPETEEFHLRLKAALLDKSHWLRADYVRKWPHHGEDSLSRYHGRQSQEDLSYRHT